MSEAGDFDPGPWKGYDFGKARKVYDVHVGRSYDSALKSNKSLEDVLPKNISTSSTAPLVIISDVTGSMGEWPAVIFSKLPYLELEGQEYLGKDMEISFAAVGDAYSDNYPLQVRPFTKGTELADRLKELVIEGGGGGQIMESYDLAAMYYSRNVSMPNAVSPILIFIGDEGLYDFVDKDQAKDICGQNIEGRLSSNQMLSELQNKYSVYLVRKPYNVSSGDSMSSEDKKVYAQWEGLLGADHICNLPEAGRVVDVIFGILAKETGRVDYFKGELEGRQKPNQVKTVYKSLHDVHLLPDKIKGKDAGKSVMQRDGNEELSKSLI
ncbi:hypothetical protein J4222_04150 [Candidatus Woesearchaeota archaeon]|nr:hypothetical protein [Candidatus Woesearchaeota archaeon]